MTAGEPYRTTRVCKNCRSTVDCLAQDDYEGGKVIGTRILRIIGCRGCDEPRVD